MDLTSAGMNELAAGDLDAATALLGEAAARCPDMPAAMLSHACLHAARGDDDVHVQSNANARLAFSLFRQRAGRC